MQNIQAAFAASSQALLHLLQHDLGLNHTLAALKHYFLLDKADLLLSFLDTAEEELSKPASEVSVIRLQSLLDLGTTRASVFWANHCKADCQCGSYTSCRLHECCVYRCEADSGPWQEVRLVGCCHLSSVLWHQLGKLLMHRLASSQCRAAAYHVRCGGEMFLCQ